MEGEELTEQETALYDRQIRVWGADAQRRLSKSRILVSGLKGVVIEQERLKQVHKTSLVVTSPQNLHPHLGETCSMSVDTLKNLSAIICRLGDVESQRHKQDAAEVKKQLKGMKLSNIKELFLNQILGMFDAQSYAPISDNNEDSFISSLSQLHLETDEDILVSLFEQLDPFKSEVEEIRQLIQASYMMQNDPRILLPGSVDWQYAGAIQVKKQLGEDCFAFATISTVEALKFILENERVALSVQQVLDALKSNKAYRALKYIQKNGITTEECYPYRNGDRGHLRVEQIVRPLFSFERIGVLTPYNSKEVWMRVVAIQPILLNIHVDHTFKKYPGGVFFGPLGLGAVNHSVVLYGYETEPVFYWKVMNSWGTDWGVNGAIFVAGHLIPSRWCSLYPLPSEEQEFHMERRLLVSRKRKRV